MLRLLTFVVAGLCLVGGLFALTHGPGHQSSAGLAPLPALKTPPLDKSKKMQSERLALINKLITSGIFQKVEVPATLPHVWVRPAFYALDFDDKQRFVSVVYAYYFDGTGTSDTVVLYDAQSGKQIGDYSDIGGGLHLN